MIVLIPAWLSLARLAIRLLWRLAALILELVLLTLWALGTLLAAAGSLAVRVYRARKRQANPLYETLRQIRNLPETGIVFRLRRIVHRY